MIKHYLHTRLKPFSFLVLSILFSLLIYSPGMKAVDELSRVLFLMLSFFVFRLIDDACSVSYDRSHHPDRSYLSPENYPTFLRLTAVSCLAYQSLLFMYSKEIGLIVSLFIFASLLLYVLFQKQFTVLSLIPLLKYPVLLYCLVFQYASNTLIFICLSSFFIMLSYDLLEDKKISDLKRFVALGALATAGFFTLFSISFPFAPVFILIPLLLVWFFPRWKYLHYLPIAYYPLCILINSLVK